MVAKVTSAAEALQEQAAGVSRLETRIAELEAQAAAAGDSLAAAKASTWQMPATSLVDESSFQIHCRLPSWYPCRLRRKSFLSKRMQRW